MNEEIIQTSTPHPTSTWAARGQGAAGVAVVAGLGWLVLRAFGRRGTETKAPRKPARKPAKKAKKRGATTSAS